MRARAHAWRLLALGSLTSLTWGCLLEPQERADAAQGERIFGFHSDSELPGAIDRYRAVVEGGQHFVLKGQGGARLNLIRLSPTERAERALVIVNGRGESTVMYGEIFDDLRSLPLRIYSYDHRGQGISERLLRDTDKGFVEGFDKYVADLEIVMDQVVGLDGYRQVYILAHSMGAAIATLYAIKHPDRVAGLILTSPMFGLVLPYTEEQLRMAAIGMAPDSWGAKQGLYDPRRPFEGNNLTGSEPRFRMVQYLYDQFYSSGAPYRAVHPRAYIGGVTWGWLSAALDATDVLKVSGGSLRVDTLMLQAGFESVVLNEVSTNFCKQAPRCRRVRVPEARHEMLLDRDMPRSIALAEIKAFLVSKLVGL